MFCPKCGSADQAPESYCKRCGEWLPNIDARTSGIGLLRHSSREQKVRKMRILELVSAGLSIGSVAMIVTFMIAGGDRVLLNLAVMCGLLVTFYQILNFFIGRNIERRKSGDGIHTTKAPAEPYSIAGHRSPELSAADTTRFSEAQSVTEGTTRQLDPQLRDRQDR